MRSYENSGYNPYNDNDRSQSRSSARNYYSDDFDITGRDRGAHGRNIYGHRSGDLGSGRDTSATSGYGGTSTYGRSAGSSNYGGSHYGSSDRDNDRTSWSSGSTYGSSGNRYTNDYDRNRHHNDRDSWDRAGDKLENTWDRTKNRVSNAWDRATNDRDRDHDRGYGSNYSSGNYGTSYGHNTGYTGNYDNRNRYSSSSDWDRDNNRWDRDRDRDHDRGFFDRAGDEVKSWFGDDEAERRRRMDEMRDREHDRDHYNRYGSSSSYGNTYNGPPYSYGSSSKRDYEW